MWLYKPNGIRTAAAVKLAEAEKHMARLHNFTDAYMC
jgi:hypothetical protein